MKPHLFILVFKLFQEKCFQSYLAKYFIGLIIKSPVGSSWRLNLTVNLTDWGTSLRVWAGRGALTWGLCLVPAAFLPGAVLLLFFWHQNWSSPDLPCPFPCWFCLGGSPLWTESPGTTSQGKPFFLQFLGVRYYVLVTRKLTTTIVQ